MRPVRADRQLHPLTVGLHEGNWTGPAAVRGDRPVDDIEGSNQADLLFGDGNDNSLFLRTGSDEAFGRGGNDFINANDKPQTHDNIGGGEGNEDECKVDQEIDSRSGCETEIMIPKEGP